MRLRLVTAAAACAAAFFIAVPVEAQTGLTEVDVELVLAVDISHSVDEEEARRQREGYVAALASPEVIDAIQGGPWGRIAVTYVEWADARLQRPAADWALIDSEEAALAFAAQVAAAPLEKGSYTAIGAAIDDAVTRIETNAYSAPRMIIDISGDGPQNQGLSLELARTRANEAGITVNGLPVITEGQSLLRAEINLEGYFQDNVVTGPSSFVLPARTEEEFRQAILRKLVLEIAGAEPSPVELGRLP